MEEVQDGFGVNNNLSQVVVLAKTFKSFDNGFYLFPAFIICLLKLEIGFTLVLTFEVNYFDFYMVFFFEFWGF